jgi:hypothetical protein
MGFLFRSSSAIFKLFNPAEPFGRSGQCSLSELILESIFTPSMRNAFLWTRKTFTDTILMATHPRTIEK